MPRKVFQGFTPLDAEDVNEFLMDQAVMSFAGTAARGSALPSPNHGMASWLQDLDSFEIYNGSSWASLGSQPTLDLLNSTSFSGVTSQQVDNVFSADYQNYKIIIKLTAGSNGLLLFLRTVSGGTPASGSIYSTGRYSVGSNSANNAFNENNTLRTEARLGGIGLSIGLGVEVNLYNPFATATTKLTNLSSGRLLSFGGVAWTVTTSYDGLQILADSGTITGTMSVYGIRES
jgi:hypothetical protein